MLDKPEADVVVRNEVTDMSALRKAVTSIEKKMDTLATMKGEYMQECKAVREDIAALYSSAKAKGVQKRALKTLIQARELRRKERDLIESLDDLQDEYEAYAEAVEQWNLPL